MMAGQPAIRTDITMTSIPTFDDLFDDLPPYFRIPSLVLDPPPSLAPLASDNRPSPLEPNARGNGNLARPSPWEPNARVVNSSIDNEQAKLSGRQKALAEAKPLGETSSNDLLRLQQDRPRTKREKLHDYERIADFVHLPIPTTAKDKPKDNPPLYQPIPVLNKLRQPPPPPPSASLFPPITPSPNASQGQGVQNRMETSKNLLQFESAVGVERRIEKQARRASLRPRSRWTEEETNQLIRGVMMFGPGKWKQILNYTHFSWLEGRTTIGLKDRFRTLFPRGFPPPGSSVDAQAQQTHDSSDNHPEQGDAQQELPHDRSSPPPDPRDSKRQKKVRRVWTAEEDVALVNGYRQYGFQWCQMVKDTSLKFVDRTGPQVRDRFRQKFPELYGQQSAPAIDPRSYSNGKPKSISERRAAPVLSAIGSNLPKDLRERRELDSGSTSDKAHAQELRNHEFITAASLSSNPSSVTAATTAPYAIMDLLNEEEEEEYEEDGEEEEGEGGNDRRNILASSSSSNYLDAEEENGPHSGVSLPYDLPDDLTLPPLQLLWEDMAIRPMFEIE